MFARVVGACAHWRAGRHLNPRHDTLDSLEELPSPEYATRERGEIPSECGVLAMRLVLGTRLLELAVERGNKLLVRVVKGDAEEGKPCEPLDIPVSRAHENLSVNTKNKIIK